MSLERVGPSQAPQDATRGAQSAGPSRVALRLFLVAGLVPGLYAARRLPVGLWHMAWGWAWIIGGMALFGLPFAYRHRKARRVLGTVVLALLAAGVFAFVMYRLSLADARSERLPEDGWAFGLAIAIQLVIVGAVLLRPRSAAGYNPTARHTAVAMGAVILTALLLVFVGRSLPAPFLVLAVGLAAARIALLPVERERSGSGLRRFITQAVLFAWAVAVIGLETRTAVREGGFVIVLAAFVVGLVVLIAFSGDATTRSRVVVSPLIAVLGAALIGGLTVLVPSEQSAHWLHDWHFDAPSSFDLAGEQYEDGNLARWYDTSLTGPEAQRAAHLGFSSFVSEWAGLEPQAIDGHVWGYQLDFRVWDLRVRPRSDLPSNHMCDTESGTCVLVLLRRSDDLDEGITRPLELGSARPAGA